MVRTWMHAAHSRGERLIRPDDPPAPNLAGNELELRIDSTERLEDLSSKRKPSVVAKQMALSDAILAERVLWGVGNVPWRRRLLLLVQHRHFEHVVIFLIMISSAGLVTAARFQTRPFTKLPGDGRTRPLI